MLAAGLGRRFGGGKLTAPLHGRPLAAHALDVVRRARANGTVAEAVAVIGPDDGALLAVVDEAGLRAVVNDAPEHGLSGSLRRGLAELGGDIGAALVLLADQPMVRDTTLAALAAGWRAGLGDFIRPRYADAPGEPGHPVLLGRAVWPLVARLEGDAGFGHLFPPGTAGVALIDVAGSNPDVDTRDDLTTLERSWT
ncbi:MAG TPA: nucleotidyltransferase family protein [Gemmatimonadales bacterium]|nr:nucleotidyltransferase family protein [Gemmatimonadales bacterium]